MLLVTFTATMLYLGFQMSSDVVYKARSCFARTVNLDRHGRRLQSNYPIAIKLQAQRLRISREHKSQMKAAQISDAGESMSTQRPPAANELLELLNETTQGKRRGGALSPEQRAHVFKLIEKLEAVGESGDAERLGGTWRLLFQGKDGPVVSATSLESWQEYLAGNGPSPLQNLVTTDSASVGAVYQTLEFDSGRGMEKGRFQNIIDFAPTGCLEIDATLEGEVAPARLAFRFQGGEFRFRALWNGSLALPYPVPFALLGDLAVGWLETLYLDSTLRVSRGNKGSVFVFARDDGVVAQPDAFLRTPIKEVLSVEEQSKPAPSKDPILVCPAQFGTPSDYDSFAADLRARGHPVFIAPLTKFNWFELVPSFLSREYWTGELEPSKVLQFYYRALDAALQDARKHLAETQDAGATSRRIHVVAHSIGGWVARAWLGEVVKPRGEIDYIASLVTLGTPHAPPPPGSWVETADQTRGLLKNVNSRFPGAHHLADGVKYIAVCSETVPGSLPLPFGLGNQQSNSNESNGWLDRALAWASYIALCGDGDSRGDGITPAISAQLPGEGITTVVLGQINGTDGAQPCYHAEFLPSPGPSIPLRGTPWYGNGAALDKWLKLIQ